MKNILLIILIVTTGTLNAQRGIAYFKKPEPDFGFRKIAKAQMEEDVRFWHTVMEESHVNLYHAISKEALLNMEKELLANVKDSITQTDAVLLIGKLAAALDEGHIGLPSSSITDSLYINSLRFPFLLQKVQDDRWIVDRDVSSEQQLGVNAAILEINGVQVSELNRIYRNYFGGLDTWRRQQIMTNVRKLLFLHGIESPFTIKAITAEGKPVSFQATGYSRKQADSLNKVLAAISKPAAAYSFTMLPDNIAYIHYRQMVNDKSNPFPAFLEKTFAAIREKNAAGLVIDLRDNGGGDSSFGDSLIQYFSSKPYRFSGGMKWKISRHYKTFLKQQTSNSNNDADNRFYNSMKDGEMYTYISRDLRKPKDTDLRFNGKTALLVGPDTFSSANMMADGISSYKLATIFGEPTGESGNDFGEMFNFMLPNSYIIARCSTKMFTRADGNENNFDPVLPDVTVKPSAADLREKKDVVLEAAVKWIRQ